MSAVGTRLMLSEIEELRAQLQRLVEEKKTLQDPEVQFASRMLDAALNRHIRLAEKQRKTAAY